MTGDPDEHPFVHRPHRTMAALAVPVLLSMLAEPLAGLVDTAFVQRLGSPQAAALGVGTAALSGVLWIFNFLSVGAQTEVARHSGTGGGSRAREIAWLALLLSGVCGVLLILVGWPCSAAAASWMGAQAEVHRGAVEYLEIRLLGAPAVLLIITAFGVLRGLQDMRSPLWIAIAISAINIALDAVLIFGAGPIPAFGIAGAAWATVASQWVGAVWAAWAVRARLGGPVALHARDARQLLVVGPDMVVRTGLLMFFLVYATRAATQIGADAGAAHQAVRQVWLFTALALDAAAVTAHSLVGYFLGADRVGLARRVAGVAMVHGVAIGLALTAGMVIAEGLVAAQLVPNPALGVFAVPWLICALGQPINALSFVTDGIHWGTRDYRYLRNGMIAATVGGIGALWMVQPAEPAALEHVWLATTLWIGIRAGCGVARIWPGVGRAPLGSP